MFAVTALNTFPMEFISGGHGGIIQNQLLSPSSVPGAGLGPRDKEQKGTQPLPH